MSTTTVESRPPGELPFHPWRDNPRMAGLLEYAERMRLRLAPIESDRYGVRLVSPRPGCDEELWLLPRGAAGVSVLMYRGAAPLRRGRNRMVAVTHRYARIVMQGMAAPPAPRSGCPRG